MNGDGKLYNVFTHLYEHYGVEKPEQCAKQAIDYLNGLSAEISNISVRALKGSTYKIKGYYMENDELSDIRGASTLISEVQNKILPDYLFEIVGFDPILYNGGGNLLALLPADVDPKIAPMVERRADEYLLTANSAYHLSEPFDLSELLGDNYGNRMREIENDLDERKKAKIAFNAEPLSGFVGNDLLGDTLSATVISTDKYCEKCKKRIAHYERNNKKVCGGCLHKVFAGEMQKSTYISEYAKRTGMHVNAPRSFADIDKDHIAVVYADGNNMGGIIQQISSISGMIDFSETVKHVMEDIVYSALAECDITSPEIVALGGDDVFLIIPGERSVRFAYTLIKKYKETFSEKFPDSDSTLSVGFSIIKPTTPIKIALEVAEEELSEAKKLVRENGGRGSLSFRVLTTYEGATSERGSETMTPYSLKCTEQLLEFSGRLSKIQDIKSRIQNLNSAFDHAEPEEASLFLDYTNAKEKNKEKRIKLPENLDGFELKNGFYFRKGNYPNDNGNEKGCYIWNDLLYLMDFGK